MTDKEKLREALQDKNSYTSHERTVMDTVHWETIKEAAAEYLKILDGDMVVVPRETIEELWTILQAITYHAEMDTLKGKRRGHWIEPKAHKAIKILEDIEAVIAAGGKDE